MADMTVSRIILEQLGGSRFTAMTGAFSFSGGENDLSFRLRPSITRHRAFGMRITLQPNDLYRLELLKLKEFAVVTIDERSDVFVDSLQAAFTEITGFATSLAA